jgi:hypothetical protein
MCIETQHDGLCGLDEWVRNVKDLIFQELIHHKAPRRHKLAVHVVSMAEGGAGLETNIQHAASDGEVIDGLVPPPPYKEVSNVYTYTQSYCSVPLMDLRFYSLYNRTTLKKFHVTSGQIKLYRMRFLYILCT